MAEGAIHLPHAPGNPSGWPRHLPDLRHGAGAAGGIGGDGPNHELIDMTRRFWIGLVLTLPVFVLEMGGPFIGQS